jgi:subtilase-type serine protease
MGAGLSHGGFTFGLGGGYVATALNFSDGSNASQNAGVGFVYGRYERGKLWLGVMGAYGGGQVDGTRALPATGLAANGERAGNFAVVQGRAAYDLALGALTLEPRATLAYWHAGQSGFTESGADLLDLAYPDGQVNETVGRLTARAMRRFTVGSWGLEPWVEAGAQETFSGLSRDVVVTDGDFGSAVAGVSPAPTAGVVGAGIDAAASRRLGFFVRYQGLFAANETGSAFSAGLAWRF